MDGNKVISGTFGRLWINGDQRAGVKSFDSKASLQNEEIECCEELGTLYKYVGYSIAGTVVLYKVDSYMAEILEEGIITGNMPDVKIVTRLADPAVHGYERVELSGVKFDELTLLKFEAKKLGEVEIPFKAERFRFLDKIRRV